MGLSPLAPQEGQEWARFTVHHEIARGNMGIVYRVSELKTGRELALKILVLGQQDPEAAERFKREARSLARLAHPHVVAVHHYGVHEGIPYLTMDYVPGTNLQELLNRAALPLPRAVDLLARIARGIDHAHSRGVVHRDLKPANVLIGPDGAPRITDFGLAKLSDASISVTQEGDMVGTPVYMSPEQIRGDIRALGPAVDVWALGVMLYLTLTGRLPFRGKTIDAVSRGVLHEDPEPPLQVAPEVPPALDAVCLAALRKDVRTRYRSAGELARDLEAYLRGRPVLAGRVTPAVRVRRMLRFARLHPVLVALIVLTLGVLAASGVFLYRDQGAQADRLTQALELRVAQHSRRGARALSAGEQALDLEDVEKALEKALEAEDAYGRAAAERAAGTEGRDESDTGPPTPERIAAGLRLDPDVRREYARARGLRGRAIVAGAEDPARDDPVPLLQSGLHEGEDLAVLPALGRMALERGSPDLADEVHAALAAVPRAPWTLYLEADLAETRPGTERPWAKELDAPGLLGGTARLLEARRQLDAGALGEAELQLAKATVPDDHPARVLLSARLARQRSDWPKHARRLEPLLAGRGHWGHLAWLERIEGSLARGVPSLAQARVKQARAARVVTPAGEAELALREAWAVSLSPEATPDVTKGLLAQTRNVDLPARVRLEAARALVLLKPDAELPTPGELGTTPARAALALTCVQLAPQLGQALGQVALRHLLPPDKAARFSEDLRVDPRPLARQAQQVEDARAFATAMLLHLDRGEVGEATDLWTRVPEWLRRNPALRVAHRLLQADPLAAPPRGEASSAPPPLGLLQGEAALAFCLDEFRRGRPDEDSEEQRDQAKSWLTMATRGDPFHLGARLARARLLLLRAGVSTPSLAAQARREALLEAAAACALDPGAPEARSLLSFVLWTLEPRKPLDLEPVRPWMRPGGPQPEAAELNLLRRLRSQNFDWGKNPNRPAEEAALELYRLLNRAADPGSFQRQPSDPTKLLQPWRSGETPLGDALLRAAEVLHNPQLLLELLVPRDEAPGLLAGLDRVAGEGGKQASQARIARTLRGLRSLDASEAPETRQRVRKQALTDLAFVARRRVSLAIPALRAIVEVWTGHPSKAELTDLLAWSWEGALYRCLDRLSRDRKLTEEERAVVERFPPIARLKARLALGE